MAVYRLRLRGRFLVPFLSFLLCCCFLYFLAFSGPRYSQLPDYAPLTTTTSQSSVAIATFLSGTHDPFEPTEEDAYFQAARILTYQLLHDPETKLKRADIPFLILCTQDISVKKRLRLLLDGAVVVFVEDVPLPHWVWTGVTRWKDQFTKLRIFEMVEYERILFIDADTLITKLIDGVFDEMMVQVPMTTLYHRHKQVRSDEMPLPSNYTFAARSDNAFTGERNHPFPPPSTNSFSAGFWVAAPSTEMFEYLMSVMDHWRRFDPHTMEQSLLNYAFRREGAMPWFELGWEWSATWPSEKDLVGGVRSLHEKFWRAGPQDLRRRFLDVRGRMVKFFKM